MTIIRLLVFMVLSLICLQATSSAAVKRVWALDDGEKIRKDDLSNALATSPENRVWNGSSVSLKGARNEIVAFQLIIEADGSGLSGVDIEISDLTNGTAKINGSRYNQALPFNYAGKGVELFTAHYLNITRRTTSSWFYDSDAKPSSYYSGWIPDALIPFAAPQGVGGAPFSIAANRNQAVWADITIPADAKAGTYTGSVVVNAGTAIVKTIPLTLQVFSFTLPDSTHLRNMFGFDPGRIEKDFAVGKRSKEYFAILQKYQQMAHRHRLDLVYNVANLNDMSTYLKSAFTGDLYSSANGYGGPCSGVGNTTFTPSLWGITPEEYGSWEASQWTQRSFTTGADSWAQWFSQNARGVLVTQFLYPDEPYELNAGPYKIDTIKMQANWLHASTGPGRSLPAFVTSHITSSLIGYVDFWSTAAHHTKSPTTTAAMVQSERSKGRRWGFYNGYRPSSGSVIIDVDAVEFRAIPWICSRYGVDMYFYWMTNRGPANASTFTQPITLDWGTDFANGDGTFFYPGTEKPYSAQDRGLTGPISSIRMKNWRRGMQDYEYLWLAKKLGMQTKVSDISGRCIPRALWDASLSGNIAWSARGNSFDRFRMELAALIEGQTATDRSVVIHGISARNRASTVHNNLQGRSIGNRDSPSGAKLPYHNGSLQ